MASTYRIADEPVGPLTSKLVVQPMYPLLALMVAGGWLGWPWLVFNGLAMKSPTRVVEVVLGVVGVLGSIALFWLLALLVGNDVVPIAAAPYGWLFIRVFQLGLAYAIQLRQERTFEIYRYYGGAVQTALPALIAGIVLRFKLGNMVPKWVDGLFF